MKADDAETAATTECGRFTKYVDTLFESTLQLIEFAIDKYANCLEGLRRRMSLLSVRRYRGGNDIGQLYGTQDRRFVACRYDRTRYARSETFFTIGFQNIADLLLIRFLQPLRGADALRGIHTHVEWTIC